MAITGISALTPLWENIPYARRIALANKESVVTAGKILFKRAAKFHTEIIPVDSEINSLFQLFNSEKEFNRVYLTASGGPLLDYNKYDLNKVTVQIPPVSVLRSGGFSVLSSLLLREKLKLPVKCRFG